MISYESIIDMPIEDGKTIKDLLTYNGICYWWSIDFAIHMYITNNKISFLDKPLILAVISIVYKHCKFVILIYDLIYKLIWSYLYAKYNTTPNTDQKNKILYRFELIEWRFKGDSNKIMNNIYHEKIINSLVCNKNLKNILAVYNVPLGQELQKSSILKFKNIMKYGEEPRIRSVPIMKYWSSRIWKEENKAIAHFNKMYSIINNSDWIIKWSELSGISDHKIRRIFKIYISYFLPVCVKYNLIYESMICQEKPALIVMTDEQMWHGRGLITIADMQYVPTIGIQHGGIAKHPAYVYHNMGVNKIINRQCSSPIPTTTLVWGISEYELLTNKSGFPKDSVKITGNPRYDKLTSPDLKYSKEYFCQKHNLNQKNKLIFWATTDKLYYEENCSYFAEVFDAVSKLENVSLIIKEHPNPASDYSKIIASYIQKYAIDVVVPDKNSDSTELVFVSDIIILKSSTIGQEAVIFHKPIIDMDFSGIEDYAEYVKEGVAIGVYKKGDLLKSLYYCINNEANFYAMQETYISRHLYKIDGLASKRCAEAIYEELKKEHQKIISPHC